VAPHWNHHFPDWKHRSHDKKESENQSTPDSKSSASKTSSSKRSMGNHPSGAESCTSGLETSKHDIVTTETSDEEVQEYLKTQAILENAKTTEEASEAVSSSKDSDPPSSKGSHSSRGGRRKSRKMSLKGAKHRGHKVFDKFSHAIHSAGYAVGHKVNQFEDFMFPHTPQFGSKHHHKPTLHIKPNVRGGVLLRGCLDEDEHKQRVRDFVELLRPLKGEDGLRAIGLEYRRVPVSADSSNNDGEADMPDLIEEKENLLSDTIQPEGGMAKEGLPVPAEEESETLTPESGVEPNEEELSAREACVDPEMI
jgi:hypothetical protein